MDPRLKEFLLHLGVQIATAATGAAVTALAGADYSSLGTFAPMAQGAAAIAVAGYNNFFSKRAKQ